MAIYVLLAVVAFLFMTSSFTESKNIVLLTIHATSHVRLYAHVANELVKMKHNVWIVIPADDRKRIELSPEVKTIWYDDYFKISALELCTSVETTVINAIETETNPDWGWLARLEDTLDEAYMNGLKDGRFIELMRSLNLDLIVIDWYPRENDQVALPYKLKLPFAVLSALQFPITAQMPYSPVSEAFNSPYIRNQASLFEKVNAVINAMTPVYNHIVNDRGYMKLIFPNDPDVPAAKELMSHAEVYIVENDPIFDYPRPALPNLKLIGGLSAGPPNEVQDPFKSFIDRSKKAGVGVAVLSFGTLLLNFPKKLEQKIVSILMRLKLNIIWRANITSPDTNKILASTWIPQNDLLGNENVKIYITHAGTHSIYEGIYHGIPTVCVPIFFDQSDNTNRAVERGYCLRVDLLTDSEDHIVDVIEEVMSSEKIKSSIGKASKIYKEIYKNPKQEAAFWLDHVMRHGGSYMRSSAQKIPQYLFYLDYIVAFGAGVVSAFVFVILCFVLKCIIGFCFAPQHKKWVKKD